MGFARNFLKRVSSKLSHSKSEQKVIVYSQTYFAWSNQLPQSTTSAPQYHLPITSSAATVSIAAPRLDIDLGDSVYTQTIYSSSSFSEAEKEKLLSQFANGSYVEPDDVIPSPASSSQPTYIPSEAVADFVDEKHDVAAEAKTSTEEQISAVDWPASVTPPTEEPKGSASSKRPRALHRSISLSNLQTQEAALVPNTSLRRAISTPILNPTSTPTPPIHSFKEWASLLHA